MRYTHLSGQSLLSNTTFNKGSAFSNSERNEFNLHGLIPTIVETIDEQSDRIRFQLNKFINDEDKHVFCVTCKIQMRFFFIITSHLISKLPCR